MASRNGKAQLFLISYIFSVAITTVLSSKCDANVLYDFIYCLSSDSSCSQCIPCYNDGPLYMPTGETSVSECSDSTCTECTSTCSKHFKNDTYIKSNNNILSTFIGKIDTTIISTIQPSDTYSFNCNEYSDYVISIKYAFIVTNHVLVENEETCSLDISSHIISECNNQKTCNFNISPHLPINCQSSTIFNAYIGSFCISKKPDYLQDECNNKSVVLVSDTVHLIYIIIITILAIILFIAIVIIILCQIKHFAHKNTQIQKTVSVSVNTVSVNTPHNGNNNLSVDDFPTINTNSSMQLGENLQATRNRALNSSVTIDTPVPMENNRSDTVRSVIIHGVPDADSGILPLIYNTDTIRINPINPINPDQNSDPYGTLALSVDKLPLTVDKTRQVNISMDVYDNMTLGEDLAYLLMNPNDDPEFVDHGSDKKQMDSNDNLISIPIPCIGHDEFQLVSEIGRGSSSKVYKVNWIQHEVAAKRFNNTFDIDNKKAGQYIDKYAQKIMDNPHDNVIKILAFANSPFTILTEYINYGSVSKYVESKRVSIKDRIRIALQAAKGIEHLHKLGIIHSEIMCRNFLMEFKNGINTRNINDIRVVITDYALQQMLTDDGLETYRSSLGPLKWMAPELIENHTNDTTQETDIYAFGITIWELCTGKEPYQDTKAVDAAIHVLIKERRPQQYAFIPEEMQTLMKKCWQTDSTKRPDADSVVEQLSKVAYNIV